MNFRIFLFSILFLTASGKAQNRIDSCMQELLRADFLRNSEVGISIFDLTADSMLYTYQADQLYHPASTEKLLTTITAIDQLGADYTIPTTLCYDGTLNDSILQGDLYIRGGFDPEFGSRDMEKLVQFLSGQGIRRIEGAVYADISLKDTLPYGIGWCWDDALYDYQPVLSPLMYHKGYLSLRVIPGQTGEPAQISVTPESDSYSIDNRTRTRHSSSGPFRVTRNLFSSDSRITVSGNVTQEKRETITIPRPQELFMSVFLQQLKERGIHHSGFGGYAECPGEVILLEEIRRPIGEVVHRALKVSDNLSAEALFYQLAAHKKGEPYASSADGTKAVNTLMLEMGLDADEYSIADGSGLSSYNYISAKVLTEFLRYAARHQYIMDVIYPALPVAGVDGTLRNRMKNSLAYDNVRAKTGTVTGTSSLAGYLTASNGHLIAFAIINQNMKEGKAARAFQDRICQMLCK